MYIPSALPSCFRLDWQVAARAFSRARAKTGERMAARVAMMAITTSSSMLVKALRAGAMRAPASRVLTGVAAARRPREGRPDQLGAGARRVAPVWRAGFQEVASARAGSAERLLRGAYCHLTSFLRRDVKARARMPAVSLGHDGGPV